MIAIFYERVIRVDKKALIAMSGGVDSSAAALLAQQMGFQCMGAIMLLHTDTLTEAVEDARKVAERLQMPFHVLDYSEQFRQCVMDAFVASYEQGLTPNPCVECNKHLKFERFLAGARELGCEYIVTGHYARIEKNPETGRFLLLRGMDADKDQSYFLYGLTQHQLSHTLFPLGNLTKAQVRETAEQFGFVNAHKRDSQDICFVPDGDYLAFMTRYCGKTYEPGDFLDREGNVVGRHKGAVGYTLGQRKGLGLAMGEPVYVCGKDMRKNTVTVGPNEALFHSALLASDWNWIAIPELKEPLRLNAKTRSRQAAQDAVVYPMADGMHKVVFDTPQRAITPGQAVVLYDGDSVVGGGTIQAVL